VSIHSSIFARVLARAAFAVLAVLPFAAANAEFVRVTAANALGNSVYDVTSFTPPGTISTLNTDGSKHGSFQALVQVANAATSTVDVLVADAILGQIIRYTPALGATPASESVVWSYTGSGSGPAHPDGLSVDSAGNLYIVTSKFFDGTKGAVWVLPANPASPTGYAPSPLLIDGTTFSNANGVTVLQETAVATTSTAAWGIGDLLVLVGNKSWPQNGNVSELVVYRAASISSVLSGGGPRGAPDLTLITNSQFPNTEFPTGMDFWPADAQVNHSTLLVATTAGRVLRYDFDPMTLAPSFQVFASNLGIGLQKIKVGLQLEVPYAFATQVLTGLTGRILQLGAPTSPGTTNLIGSATQGVLEPDGLAVARTAAVTAQSCATPAGCDISNGVDPHQITLTGNTVLTGNITEQTCVILTDTRYDANGNCANVELDARTFCPGFNVSIPGETCGGSGISKKGFALIRTVANGVDNLPGNPLIVKTQDGVDNILPPAAGGSNPSCNAFSLNPFSPFAVISWAPRTDATPTEGTIVEAQGDPLGLTPLIDSEGLCDNSLGFSRGGSYFAVGLIYNAVALGGPNGFSTFALKKYTNLFNTADAANISTTITPPAVTSTKGALETALGQVNTYLGQQDYACAANEVVTTNALVANDPNPAANYPGDSVNNPNPWGEVQGRLANLYVILNTLILGNPTNAEWPLALPDAPPVCGPPTVTLNANMPTSIQPNTATTLTWSSQHALSCTASGGWSGSQALSGKNVSTGNLASTTTFTLVCTGFNNQTSPPAMATVTVVPPPTITNLSASPPIFASNIGASPTISWTSTYATSCTVSGGTFSFNVNNLAGTSSPVVSSVPATAINATTQYTVNCTNSLGVAAGAQTVTVTAVVPPTISTFSASPMSVSPGGSTTFSWSLTGTDASTSCAVGTPAGSVPAGTSGVTLTNLQATATYTLACSNSSGGVAATQMAPNTVTVTVVPSPTIANLSANPSIFASTSGSSSTISWNSTYATSCTVSGGTFSSTVTLAGSSSAVASSVPVTGINATTQYTVNCTNSLGVMVSQQISVTVVTPPTVSGFSASPATVTAGGSTTFSWTLAGTANFSTSCAIGTPSGTVLQVPTGANSFTINNLQTTNSGVYTLACTNASGNVTATATSLKVTVTVAAPVKIVSFTANPTTVYDEGRTSSLSWSATTIAANPTSCAITGGGLNLTKLGATGGPLITLPLRSTTTFTLTCSNSSSKATATTTVTVIDSDHDSD
jgi:hypothetical protein